MVNLLAYGENVIGGDIDNSGGHTIENPSGTAMTQRNNLQFAGSAITVTDDSANDRTVVTISGGSGSGLTILSYGTATWNDFVTAYNNNNVVFCKASITDSDPSSGTQSRHAVLSYVDDPANPTQAEFLYPKTTNRHDYNHQTDQMIVYTLDSTNGWSCTVRYTSTNISPQDGIAYTYNSTKGGTIYLSTPSITGSFSDAINYTVGDYVYYNNNLYKCATAHTGAWDASHFTQTTVGEELKNAGHKILDSDGTSLTKRTDLQFGDYLKTTDDSTNLRTIVSDAPTTVTYQQWSQMTDAEKDGTKWLITDVPSAEGEVEIENLHLAWTNSDPTASFAGQTVTLDTDDYDFYVVYARFADTVPLIFSETIPKGQNGYIRLPYAYPSNLISSRTFSPVYSTQYKTIQFESAVTNGTVNNAYCIPYQIYTGKYMQTAKISAIATNVSTQADHCMIDQNTSVKDMTQDSGWTTLNSYVRIRKIGKQVCIETKFVDSVITSTTWATFGTLPEGYRPSSNAFNCLLSHSNGNFQDVKFSTDGTIQVIGNVTVYGYTTYFVD